QRRDPVRLAREVPGTVRALAGGDRRAQPFARDAGALGGDGGRRGVAEIAPRRPADRRVPDAEPTGDVHDGHLTASTRGCAARTMASTARALTEITFRASTPTPACCPLRTATGTRRRRWSSCPRSASPATRSPTSRRRC